MKGPFQPEGSVMAVSASGPVHARVSVPSSKSLTNRYLLLASLAAGQSTLKNPLNSDDTQYMKAALHQVGVGILTQESEWNITGRPLWNETAEPIFVGNAGTAMRFLTPALALSHHASVITGNERMLVRPIGDLVEGLRGLDVSVTYLEKDGYPPLRIKGPCQPGSISIKGNASSQYLSGLLMCLPLLEHSSRIEISGDLVSRTYVEMTLNCMEEMGVTVETNSGFRNFHIEGGQRYQPQTIAVEPDASTASYWFALPLMIDGSVQVAHIPNHSHQGDFGLLEIFRSMGAGVERNAEGVRIANGDLQGIQVDMNTMSDVAPTLAVVATRAKTPTTITNIGNMRIKECDRIATLQTAFDALGLTMESGSDWIKVLPGKAKQSALLDPQDDHRMAMVFSLLGLADGGVTLKNPECVAKTYPNFFEEMGKALQNA